jgi:flagellar biogenesis protein FliO
MKLEEIATLSRAGKPIGGLAGWLLGRLHVGRRAPARLAVLERITLAPRQSLSLIEAEGRRFLVATSPEGTPAFYALDHADGEEARSRRAMPGRSAGRSRRVGREAGRPGADRDLRVSW